MNALDLTVIHDAKNGLGSLLLSLEKRGHFEDEMQLILRISTRLTHLLLWHKEQEGDMHLNVDSASPSDLLKELGAEYQQIFPHLTISVDVTKAPIFWFYDIIYTRLALENAVHNACNYARTRVDLSASMSTNKLMFSVSDDGEGFTPDVLAHLAKQKYTVASERGTGLGMVLSSAIAQQHINKGEHGYIQLYNDEGAVFEMLLP